MLSTFEEQIRDEVVEIQWAKEKKERMEFEWSRNQII